jgi:hypothetical protein
MQVGQQFLECLKSAGRGSNPDDGKFVRLGSLHPCMSPQTSLRGLNPFFGRAAGLFH